MTWLPQTRGFHRDVRGSIIAGAVGLVLGVALEVAIDGRAVELRRVVLMMFVLPALAVCFALLKSREET